MSDILVVERRSEIAVIWLNRPRKRNALDLPLATALVGAIRSSSDSRAIALLSSGRHFCVGGDISAMADADDTYEYVLSLAYALHDAIREMHLAPPIVAGVCGWAAGAGMSVAAAADIVVAGQTASLRPAYLGIGATPDGGLTWTLPRLIGERRARAILLQNQQVDAARAAELGLVDDVVDDDAVIAKTIEIAEAIAAGPRSALTDTKQLTVESSTRDLDTHLDVEARFIAKNVAGPDGQEGLRAFQQRRTPRFL